MCKSSEAEKHSLSGKKQNRNFPDGPVARIVEGLVQSPAGDQDPTSCMVRPTKQKPKKAWSAGGRVAEGNMS